MAQDRPNDLLQGGEREMRLRLDAGAAQNDHVAGLVARVLQECRLADARLAGEDQHCAVRRSSAGEELADTGALRVSPVEHRVIVRRISKNPAKSPARRRATAAMDEERYTPRAQKECSLDDHRPRPLRPPLEDARACSR